MVPFFMQGDALGWFKWMHSNKQLSTWEAFTRALELRFGPSSFTNHEAALFKLKQHGSVSDFQLQFETLSNCVEGLSLTSLLNCFISDLKDEIQHELAVLKPTSLAEAIRLAKLIEAMTRNWNPPWTHWCWSKSFLLSHLTSSHHGTYFITDTLRPRQNKWIGCFSVDWLGQLP